MTVRGTMLNGGEEEALEIRQAGDPADQRTVRVPSSNVVLDLEGVIER